ncbi:MAG: formate dehydrogenase family accessory protein FdhD [Bdellovibrionales bacterium RIFOXYD1_FULL_53_11]|nr:MAG: formate dehydrogenase family accessory protein FdhD [Bdellovibrionales bacterium RIFOXYD1_FULL_53_11]
MFLKEQVTVFDGNGKKTVEDLVAVEEPLSLLLNGKPLYMTMRNPGSDVALAAGYCYTEGIIRSMDDLQSISQCDDSPDRNIVRILVNPESEARAAAARSRAGRIVYSSCGLCGETAIKENIDLPPRPSRMRTSFSRLLACAERLSREQRLFPKTGAAHAAACFNDRHELVSFAEDVGRHNALDKAVGKAVLQQDAARHIGLIILSSRVSFEMVLKALRTGAEIIAGVSAPTTLAIRLARESNMTLVGFLRGTRFNVYCGAERFE